MSELARKLRAEADGVEGDFEQGFAAGWFREAADEIERLEGVVAGAVPPATGAIVVVHSGPGEAIELHLCASGGVANRVAAGLFAPDMPPLEVRRVVRCEWHPE